MPSITSVNRESSRGNDINQTFGRRCVEFLLQRRVRITVVVFAALIAEDVLVGFRPHDLLNYHDGHTLLGLALVAAGVATRTWAAGILHKQKQLTTVGPYALMRHPLYAGSLMMMIGFAALIDDPENIWIILGPILGMYVLRAVREERVLSRHFSSQWEDYAKAVPRFIPYRGSKHVFAPWRMTQWITNREYQAVFAVALGLMAIEAWSRY
jgi:protein-S-isoprenylcysteine O-methyltransferase Ste14